MTNRPQTSSVCVLGGLLCMALIAGCSREPQAWEEAAGTDTEAAYEAYLTDYADGANAQEATARLQSIRGDRAWAALSDERTAESLGAFVEMYPEHTAIDEARFLFDVYRRAEEWGAEDMRIVGAEIVSAENGGIGLEFDEPLNNPDIGMISTSVGLSSTEDLIFDPADLVVGNHVQLYMVWMETELTQMTIKHWSPVAFVAD